MSYIFLLFILIILLIFCYFIFNKNLTSPSFISVAMFLFCAILSLIGLKYWNVETELNNQIINEKNIAYGSKYRTGYAWKLNNVKKIKSDKIINGKLGLWNIDNNY